MANKKSTKKITFYIKESSGDYEVYKDKGNILEYAYGGDNVYLVTVTKKFKVIDKSIKLVEIK